MNHLTPLGELIQLHNHLNDLLLCADTESELGLARYEANRHFYNMVRASIDRLHRAGYSDPVQAAQHREG